MEIRVTEQVWTHSVLRKWEDYVNKVKLSKTISGLCVLLLHKNRTSLKTFNLNSAGPKVYRQDLKK
jgi:hypothetical protein